METKLQLPPGLQQVIRQMLKIVFAAKDNDQLGLLATIPNRPILGLIGIPERNRILKRDQIEATLLNLSQHSFFSQ